MFHLGYCSSPRSASDHNFVSYTYYYTTSLLKRLKSWHVFHFDSKMTQCSVFSLIARWRSAVFTSSFIIKEQNRLSIVLTLPPMLPLVTIFEYHVPLLRWGPFWTAPNEFHFGVSHGNSYKRLTGHRIKSISLCPK